MAQAKARSSGKARTSAQGTKRKPSTKSARTSSNGSKATSKARVKPSNSKSKSASRNGTAKPRELVERLKAPASKLATPVGAGVATVAGVVGGAVLGTKLASKPKRVLGVPVPGTGRNSLAKQVGKSAKQVGKAGKQAGELAEEVRAARKKAEEVGKAIS